MNSQGLMVSKIGSVPHSPAVVRKWESTRSENWNIRTQESLSERLAQRHHIAVGIYVLRCRPRQPCSKDDAPETAYLKQ